MLFAVIVALSVLGYVSIAGIVYGYMRSQMDNYEWQRQPYFFLPCVWPLLAIWFLIFRLPITSSVRFGRYLALKNMQRQKTALETRRRVVSNINNLRVETSILEAEAAIEVEECLKAGRA